MGKYEEALERAKSFIERGGEYDRQVMESIFPELKESEDEEKMLNTIIRGFESWKANGNLRFNNTDVDKIIAYLEKHKDSLHVSETCKENPDSFTNERRSAEWSEEDESILRLIHEALSCAYSVKNMDAQTCSVMREWLNNRVKSIRPQPHWKPSEEQMRILAKVFDGQMLNKMEQMSMETLYDDLKKL